MGYNLFNIHYFLVCRGGGGGGDSCLFAASDQYFFHCRLPNLLPVLLNIGSSHERNTLIVYYNNLAIASYLVLTSCNEYALTC